MRRIAFQDPSRFRPGDRVRIVEGSFKDIEGKVETVDLENERVSILVSVFGRKTPVNADMWQLEKLID